MHHYNFPPYSVGETGFMRGPKRRDIGHGALAQRALEAVDPVAGGVPVHDPARLGDARVERLVVDGLGLRLDDVADGRRRADRGARLAASRWASSRRATTTSSSPTSREPRTTSATWTSRSPARDEGITALQMDIKITGVTQEIMRSALEQAKRARAFILDRMRETISEPRAELAGHAPRISSIQINPDFIGMVIGKGGETIRSLEADYDVQIDIEEDGTILVYATEGTKADAAISAIAAMTKEPEVGDTYTGRVVKTTEFGAFVELKKGTDGLLHVSNVGPGRVAHIEDVIARGDTLDVVVQEVDKERGRIGLKLVAKHEDGALVSPESSSSGRRTPRRASRARPATIAAGAAATGAAAATDWSAVGIRGSGFPPRDPELSAGGNLRGGFPPRDPPPRRGTSLKASPSAPQLPQSGWVPAGEPVAGGQTPKMPPPRTARLPSRRARAPDHDAARRGARGDRAAPRGALGGARALDRRPARATSRPPAPACRTSSSTCSSRARRATPRRRSPSSSTRWAGSSTPRRRARRPSSTRASPTAASSRRSTR